MSNSYDDKTTNATNNNNEENSETKYKKITVYEIPNSTKKNVPKKVVVHFPEDKESFTKHYSKLVAETIKDIINRD